MYFKKVFTYKNTVCYYVLVFPIILRGGIIRVNVLADKNKFKEN